MKREREGGREDEDEEQFGRNRLKVIFHSHVIQVILMKKKR